MAFLDLLMQLEKNIRGIAFSGGWFKLIIDGPSGFSALSGTSRSGPSQKRGPGRRSKKQYASSESAVVSSEDSGKDVQWWRGGKFSEVILQNGTLPSSLVRKAARQGKIYPIKFLRFSFPTQFPTGSLKRLLIAGETFSSC